MARLTSPPSKLNRLPRAVGFADRADAMRARDAARRAAENSLRGEYNKKRWRQLRLEILERDGWMCAGCAVPHLLVGKAPAPTSAVVDHIEPHRGNLALFFDPENLQSVCKAYHDSEKQRLEKSGPLARP